MKYKNQTKEDAFLRIQDARMGCFVNASDDYLFKLRSNLLYWIADIEEELAERFKREQRQKENEDL